jgi:hypothetical protein
MNLEIALNQLYSSQEPDVRFKASQWLEAFQKSQDAWDICFKNIGVSINE